MNERLVLNPALMAFTGSNVGGYRPCLVPLKTGRTRQQILPFPDQNQLFRSGRTFTFEQANKNDRDWDFAADLSVLGN